jgi:hypothetical protein
MKLKAIIMSLLFIGALFTGTALAADKIHGFHKVDDLKDQTVNSIDGEELGTIDNLLISDNGDVFIVLSKDDKMVPVPWEAANLSKGQDDKLTSSITQQQLEGAPSMEDVADFSQHEQEARGYFGTDSQIRTQPYGTEPYGKEKDSPMSQDPPQPRSPGQVN